MHSLEWLNALLSPTSESLSHWNLGSCFHNNCYSNRVSVTSSGVSHCQCSSWKGGGDELFWTRASQGREWRKQTTTTENMTKIVLNKKNNEVQNSTCCACAKNYASCLHVLIDSLLSSHLYNKSITDHIVFRLIYKSLTLLNAIDFKCSKQQSLPCNSLFTGTAHYVHKCEEVTH